mmetsp:Transcript_4884/g.10232  ORF Transcript_4884/g.10232 Transcript_4884/m.10232 type:complete len:222 (+) Transcript_4884:76-741(+)|eukprot:CAMPEP_0197545414 /NCGR_PEP_ID=MMETSP1320-20131121/470_1 /TAXON_ID=91990 /ORGANISM="Bolidomonas sp., Strain RCC2347" /LENGTH=221 /DNA_ID=CAMNT_0043104925 /DNA_START=45 /DNA_END=710 /DNA_ORIENTATION=-
MSPPLLPRLLLRPSGLGLLRGSSRVVPSCRFSSLPPFPYPLPKPRPPSNPSVSPPPLSDVRRPPSSSSSNGEYYVVKHKGQYDRAMDGEHGDRLRALRGTDPLLTGVPSASQFAVVELSGTQFKVSPNDVLTTEKLKPLSKWSVGSVVRMSDNVVLHGSAAETRVGSPYLPNVVVTVRVEEITHDATVVVFKKRRRKNSQRKNGHRREVTVLRVLGIDVEE